MSIPAISVRNLSKCYRLGTIGRHTLVDEAQYWWHKIRGRDPREHLGKVGHSETEARKVEAERAGANDFWALRDVSFEVQAGEVMGVIGRNGAGKSTLLKILTRITEPTKGEAFINGRVAALLEVGTGFHPELTGRENIFLNGTILGMKRREVARKLDEITAFAELDQFIDTPVKRYSSGMYVRLAFAVAAHLEPEILLVDEVLAVGDAGFQKKCLGKMSQVASEGRTVLFVSHNMAAIRSLTSRCLLVQNGRLALDGESDDAVDRYLATVSPETGSGRVDVTDEMRSDAKKQVRRQVEYRRIELLNGAGSVSGTFGERETLVIRAEIESRVEVERLEVLFQVKTMDDVVVCTLSSGQTDARLAPGSYCVSCELRDPALAQGRYRLMAYLLSGSRVAQDYLPSALVFDVVVKESTGLTERDIGHGHTHGDVLLVSREWSRPAKIG